MFTPKTGAAWWGFVIGSLVLSAILVAVLQAVPQRFRRPIILTATFIGGLFYALEFFLPVAPMPTPQDPNRMGNFLTPYVVPFADTLPVIAGFTVGLGVINLFLLHGRRILKGATGWTNSLVFFIAFFLMLTFGILDKTAPEGSIPKNIYYLLQEGAYQALDATMFSIIAFYIVSAAYRAFRVRSLEATMLLITAMVVMLGQITVGQMLTNWLPEQSESFWGNFRVEVMRDWILTKANTPAVRAINFGLGVGSLAVALRIWLGLERGSYFDSQR
ncbi:MAG: hypothetical protein RMJ43_01325 [Chloroherpetonaceae bacterium]|nr:hypothetical protein [Chthonomonadaceae bacterium]MDW8206449.1 hypothetical protein [Chloroherpetonaceae bacterium]